MERCEVELVDVRLMICSAMAGVKKGEIREREESDSSISLDHHLEEWVA